MSPRRTDGGGSRINRDRGIRFTFDGKPYSGHPGDTLASALLANGVTLFGRSFKYHRPRGVLTAGVDEPNALVTVLKGSGTEVQSFANHVIAERGVRHGHVVYVPSTESAAHSHSHSHGHGHSHSHSHSHSHEHAPAKSRRPKTS